MNLLRFRLFGCILCILLITNCGHHSKELSKAVGEFKDTTRHVTALYFYPSTLEMLNFNKDSSYSMLIKDIEKLRILTFKSDKDSVSPDKMNALAKSVRKESFVDLMQVKQKDYTILVFMRKENKKPREFIGIIYGLKDFFIIDLLGSIPMSVLPKLTTGNFNMSGLSTVLNFKKTATPQKNKKQQDKHGDDSGNK